MIKNWKNIVLKKFEELDPKEEIVTIFDEKNKKIDFSNCIKQHQKQNFEDEAYIRAYLVLRLTKELDYPCEAIELEKKYSIGHPSKKEARLDILVKTKKGHPFMLVECKTPENFIKEKDDAIENQLFAIAKQEIKGKIKPKYLVLYTIEIENGEVLDRAIIIDFEQFPTYEDWKEAGEPSLDEIPADYGTAKKYTYANIEKPDPIRGLKPLRKDYTLADFEKLRVDLHNKLWAGGEADYNDIFYHLIKIMLVKVYDELFTPEGEIYDFQIFYKNGKPETPEELAKRLEEKYKIALKELLNYDDEKIKEIPLIEKDKFTYEKLFYAVEKLQEISLTENIHSKEEDVLGLFFESILQNEFKQSKGQYFTHKNIVRFLIYALELDKLAIHKLNQPYPHFPYIIDPAAGSGTFLIEAMKIITKEVLKNKDKLRLTRSLKEIIKDLEDPNRKHRWAEDYIYGIEPNARLGLATKLNMILHGDGNMNIFIEDGLMPFKIKDKPFYTRKWKGKDVGLLAESEETDIYPKLINKRFDVVMSNPPFSMKIEAMRSYKYIKDTFVFYDKKNSENLFIERWFQLLAPKGRLGVVLPESVFDTKENLYIRNFLYKYFRIKAIISLPKEAFEPYTSTKVSLLIAERKTDEEIKAWEDKWREYANKYNKLRNSKIIQFFIDNDKILNSFRRLLDRHNIEMDYSKVLVHDLLDENSKDIIEMKIPDKDKNKFKAFVKKIESFKKKYKLEELDTEENRKILKEFLKQFYPQEQEFKSFKELLEYVYDDVLEIATLDYPQIKEQNNYCNSWWVFGEVSKHFNYPIFYAEIENIGYKRTKRGEQDKDIPIKDENGNIIAFKNDFFKIKAEKVKRTYWVKKGNKAVQEEKEEIIKTGIIIDTENPETVLDYLRIPTLNESRILNDKMFILEFKDLGNSISLRADYKFVRYNIFKLKSYKKTIKNPLKLRQVIYDLRNGKDIAKKYYSDYETDICYLTVNNIKPFEKIQFDNIIFLKEEKEIEEMAQKIKINDGDYIITRSGTVGVVHKFSFDELPEQFKDKIFIPSGYLMIFKVDKKYDNKNLLFYLSSKLSREYFEATACGKSQQNLSQEDLKRWIIPIDKISKIPVDVVESKLIEIEKLKRQIISLENKIEEEIEKAILEKGTKD